MSTLTDLIREVAEERPEAQPEEIAAEVAKRTPSEQLVKFYAEALRPLVLSILGYERRTAMDEALNAQPVTEKPKRRGRSRSKKAERTASWWTEMKNSRVHTERGHVRLGSCTRADLEFCIAARRRHIDTVEAQIVNYQRLIDLLDEYGVTTVDELPEQRKPAA
jgi:hypothetical protein